jgi:hypothetical protein
VFRKAPHNSVSITSSRLHNNDVRYQDIEWGPVFITADPHKGRIGDLDDEEDGNGIVYFGTIFRHHSSARIPLRSLRAITTQDLMNRAEAISRLISLGSDPLPSETELDVLYEDHYISDVLQGRWFAAQEKRKGDIGVFLSYSSADQQTVRWIAVDLANRGYRVWLDEWEIAAGESIPKRISEGIEECEVLVVALSPTAVSSSWVEREWHAKYWDEVERKHLSVIPILLRPCAIPPLLRSKRYADFSQDSSAGMDELIKGLRKIENLAKRQARSAKRPRTAASKRAETA